MNKREKEVAQVLLGEEGGMLKRLERMYTHALDDINGRIRLLQSAPETQSRIYHVEYQKTLKKQVAAILEKLHADEYTSVQEYLNDSYTMGYIGTMYSIAGQGVCPIIPIDQNAVYKAVVLDSKIKESLYESFGVDINAMKKTISSVISRGIASGMSYADMALSIRNASGVPLKRAKAIVRTDGHRIQQASAEDARQAAKEAGADVVKQWDSVLDGETRDSHRALDGQIREVNEPFSYGGKKAMYPGEFGDPAEDCNCRCVANTRARWALDEDELERLQERAKFFGLDKTDSINDFRNKYLKAAETVENTGKSGIIISDKQLGHKAGRHMQEWGLNPSSAEDRAKFVEITINIQANAQEVRRVEWLHDPETGRRTVEVNCYILGNDVVLVKDDGEYLTTMFGGINNGRVKNGRRIER